MYGPQVQTGVSFSLDSSADLCDSRLFLRDSPRHAVALRLDDRRVSDHALCLRRDSALVVASRVLVPLNVPADRLSHTGGVYVVVVTQVTADRW